MACEGVTSEYPKVYSLLLTCPNSPEEQGTSLGSVSKLEH